MSARKRVGKFKAIVADVNDPEKRGRIRVVCPDVTGESKSAWCNPCIPFAYEGGGDFYLPKKGDTVFVEFEDGNPNKPMYGSGWHSEGNTPVGDYSNASKVRIISFGGARIVMTSGSISLSAGGCNIVMSEGKVDIKCDQFTVNGKNIELNSEGNALIDANGTATVSGKGMAIVRGDTGAILSSPASALVKGDSGVDVQSGASVDLNAGGAVNLDGSAIRANGADVMTI
jgi:hypothetical protein